ncbi:MAG: DMT family transporter [Sporomusaceae bacterium]|nr:DMT family transporter [Sporomusaceae bacterium]
MSYNSGIIYAVIADGIWALAFIIPKLLPSYSAVEITCGRFLVYGVFSIVIWLCRKKNMFFPNGGRKIWSQALLFAFCGNLGYYFFLVLAIQLAGVTLSTLVIGMLPITVSLYGNWLFREFSFKRVLPSVLLVLCGIIVINSYNLQMNDALFNNILGLFFGIVALALWTWYGVANVRFLKRHPQISSKDWATISGIATFILLTFFLVILSLYSHSFYIYYLFQPDESNVYFWLGSLILGFLCSWGATVFWNKASNRLPTALAGQLIVGEMIFGLLYGYIFEYRLPHYFEFVGIIIIIGGLFYGIHIINVGKRLMFHGHVQKEQS